MRALGLAVAALVAALPATTQTEFYSFAGKNFCLVQKSGGTRLETGRAFNWTNAPKSFEFESVYCKHDNSEQDPNGLCFGMPDGAVKVAIRNASNEQQYADFQPAFGGQYMSYTGDAVTIGARGELWYSTFTLTDDDDMAVFWFEAQCFKP